MIKKDKIRDNLNIKINKYINEGVESSNFEVKRQKPNSMSKLAKQIVGIANTNNGGYVVIGIDENNLETNNINNRDEIVNGINQSLIHGYNVTPKIQYEYVYLEYNNDDILGLYIKSIDGTLHSIEKGEKHYFPYRDNSSTRSLDGNEVKEYFVNGYYPDTLRPSNREYLKFDMKKENENFSEIKKEKSMLGDIIIPIQIMPEKMNGVMIQENLDSFNIQEIEDLMYRINNKSKETLKNYGSMSFAQKNYNWVGYDDISGYFSELKNINKVIKSNDNNEPHKSTPSIFISNYDIGNLRFKLILSISLKYKSNNVRYCTISIIFGDEPIDISPVKDIFDKADINIQKWKKYNITELYKESPKKKIKTQNTYVDDNNIYRFLIPYNKNKINVESLLLNNHETYYGNEEINENYIYLNKIKFFNLSDFVPSLKPKGYWMDISINNM